jgi:hypothetical protein
MLYEGSKIIRSVEVENNQCGGCFFLSLVLIPLEYFPTVLRKRRPLVVKAFRAVKNLSQIGG